jgi:hypothetical protein
MSAPQDEKPSPGIGRKKLAVNISLGIMLLGVLMVCQPFVHLFYQYGFIVTIAGIVAFSFAGHMKDD